MKRKIDGANLFIFGTFGILSIILLCLLIIPNLPKHYSKEEIYRAYHQRLALMHFYATDNYSIGLMDTEKTKAAHKWNEYGLAYVYSMYDDTDHIESNEFIDKYLHSNPDEWKNIDTIYAMLVSKNIKLTEYSIFDPYAYQIPELSEKEKNYSYDKMLSKIEKKRGYTKKNIDDAMEVFIYGGLNVSADNEYKNILMIPYDLQNACFAAINKSGLSNEMLEIYWHKLVKTVEKEDT